ncbi:MAG: TonB-dependent receptor [Opitutaceae bacterium]|nr:TonB-dependent receptor [Opitutaceae bacterium]
MNTTPAAGRRPTRRLLPLLGLALWFLFATSGYAQSAGTIAGRVSNAGTRVYLEEVEVTLRPLGWTAQTGRDGRFVFRNVPPGSYTLSAAYTGLETRTNDVSVGAGATVTEDIELTSGVYTLGEFVVAGEREGSALAIQQQRYAPNVKNVLSSDAFGNVADENLGNFLVRLPGVGTQVLEGDIVFVQVRGIHADLSAVTMDGSRGASGGPQAGMNRAFEIDKIPADFIETIEVTKAPTPDMDADSIGGAVNLVTKSAFNRRGRTITYQAGTSYNVDRSTFRPALSFMYSDILGQEQKLGVMVTASFNRTHKPRDSSNLTWRATTNTDVPAPFIINTYGEDQLKHTRAGTGIRFDYKLGEDSTVYFNTMFSHYEDGLNRHWGRFAGVNLNNVFSFFAPNGQPRTATNAAATVLPGWTDTITETINHRFEYAQNLRERAIRTWNLRAGGNRKFPTAELDYNVSFSHSRGTNLRLIPTSTVSGVGFRFDRDTPGSNALASYTQISGPDIYDIDNRILTSVNTNDDVKTDRIWGAQVNLKKNFAFVAPTYAKIGLRARGQDVIQRFGRGFFSFRGPDGVAGRNPATGVNDDNLTQFVDQGYGYHSYDGFYPSAPWMHLPTLEATMASSPAHFVEDPVNTLTQALRNNISAEEQVYSAYIMGSTRLGRLNILTGLRVEETHVTGKGTVQVLTPEERARRAAWSGALTEEERLRRIRAEYVPRTNSGKYRDVFPSVHFRYEFFEGILARASYSTGIGRPAFATIIPNDRIDDENERATISNTALEPQYADNFDLSLEYYFKPVGLLSAGVFLKELSSFIFTADMGEIPAGPDNGFAGDYAGYILRTQANGGSATVRGLELAYQQQFSNLPGFWKGFGIFVNYTRLETKGDYGDIGVNTGPADLVGFVPKSGNIGITYNAHPWSVRAQMNYTGSQLFRFNSNLANRQYEYSKNPLDLSVKYSFGPRFSVYCDVINVFRSPIQRRYQYVPTREMGHDLYSPVIKAGISGRF